MNSVERESVKNCATEKSKEDLYGQIQHLKKNLKKESTKQRLTVNNIIAKENSCEMKNQTYISRLDLSPNNRSQDIYLLASSIGLR